ncbi:MAG: LysM peptidoglycan-binding domain-containing protein [Lachnospiraceae bacterium]|nr:LysM peptidoglycan-binding domain-containing protein [Lachnospiraceae bacterium]
MNQRYCNGMVHVIKQGDNLYQLSRMYRVPLALILRANPYVDVYNLQPGQEICIPVARPYPGMQRTETQSTETQRTGTSEMSDENQSDGMDPNMNQNMNQNMDGNTTSLEREETNEDVETYVCDGTKGVGEILQEWGVAWSDIAERNDLNKIIIAADVVLYLPKKV